MSEKSLEQLLTELRANNKLVTVKPTRVIWRPEDIERVARARGCSEQEVIDSLMALGAVKE